MLLAEIDSNLLFVAGAAVMVIALMRWKRRHPSREQAMIEPLASRLGAGPPPSLDQWEVRMHDVARDLLGQLDTKICIVQELLARAEAQTGRLEAAIQRLDSLQAQRPAQDDAGINQP